MNRLKDVDDFGRLILSEITPAIVELSNKKIGSWNMGTDKGIYYIFNGKEYLITVQEVENDNERIVRAGGISE